MGSALPPTTLDTSGLDNTTKNNMNAGGPKTAEDFLGANANLVNLDNLVSRPAPSPSM